jgi:hypothetical protein
VEWRVLDGVVFASIQVTAPGDRLLDIRHEIVNLGISIPDKDNKTGTDKHATMFLKNKTVYIHLIFTYALIKLLEL